MREEKKLEKGGIKKGKEGQMNEREEEKEEGGGGAVGVKMRGWRSITPPDGVADCCCRANAELLRNRSLMDGSFAG